jgi:hypothetical protein
METALIEELGELAVDVAKLRDYVLNDRHPRGRHKARVFQSRLGLTRTDAEWLRNALLEAALRLKSEFQPLQADSYGRRFSLDIPVTTAAGAAIVRSAWIVRAGDDVVRLVTCYVL